MGDDYKRHDRVIAIRDIGSGNEKAAKGTKGTVVDVDHGGWFSDPSYDVMFDTEVILNRVASKDLYPAKPVDGV